MMTEKAVAQSYVLAEGGSRHTLRYYLISEMRNEALSYGITISDEISDSTECGSRIVSSDRDAVLRLIQIYAENFVFPVSLNDLIDDWVIENREAS